MELNQTPSRFGLKTGMTHTSYLKVTDKTLVPSFGEMFEAYEGMPPVLATIIMLGLVEDACGQIAHPVLDKIGKVSLGAEISAEHLRPTVNGVAEARANLVRISGRELHFESTCHAHGKLIGTAKHKRVIVDKEPFLRRLQDEAND